jgi:isoquinoline 1-oxidoreductase beta subunit
VGLDLRFKASARNHRYQRCSPSSARKDGDADAALKGAAKTLEAAYEFPYLAHASMEPMNCVVKLDGGGCEIWNCEQFQTADQAAVAKLLGLEAGQVSIH